jgi:hypothetical protein
MPPSGRIYERKFNASAECWSVFEEVIGEEFSNAVLFGQVHQLTVDAYAVQHAGGEHPDKSVAIHLAGLYLVLDRGLAPTQIPPVLQRLAGRESWPHLDPPAERTALTVFDVGLAASPEEHARTAREWAEQVWQVWTPHHATARDLVATVGPGPA